MAVNVQAGGQGGVNLGGSLDLSGFGMGSAATWSVGVFAVLVVLIVLVVVSLR